MVLYPAISTFTRGNYSSTQRQLQQTWIKPRYVQATEGFKALNPYEKANYHALARDLFRSSPSIRSSIVRKNSWACSNGWVPTFKGEDKEYGRIITDFLSEVVYPNCNTAGGNYNFNRTLLSIANEIDVGGDALVIFVQGRDGLLKMSVYPSSVVGQRNYKEVVEEGRYKGASIFDGVVYDGKNSPVAYSILEDDTEEDYYVSAFNASLLFEPVEGQAFRGVSVIASALRDAFTVSDTEEYLSRTVKLQSKMGIMVGTKDGSGNEYQDGYGVGASEASTCTEREQPVISDMGDFMFLDAKNNENAKAFEPKAPGKDIPDWLSKMEEKVLYSIGWHLALISPGSIGSYAARVMESQVQQLVSERQQTLKRLAKTYCVAAIAKAIDAGDIPAPKNQDDWRKIDFHMPATFAIDSYYGAQTDLQQWTTGNNSLRRIIARQGGDWRDIRQEREEEAEDALTRAQRLAAKFGVSVERALDLISKQSQNAAPAQQTPIQTEQ